VAVAAIIAVATVLLLLMLGPVWAVLAGGFVGYVCGVYIAGLAEKTRMARLKISALVVTFFYLVAGMWTFLSTLSQANEIYRVAEEHQWQVFSGTSEENRFVSENYRPCLDSESTVYYTGSIKVAPSPTTLKNNPVACKAAVVTLAKAARGDGFAAQVSAAIAAWDTRDRSLSPDQEAKLRNLLAQIGYPYRPVRN
jgi:hypothetical protein